jgi:hypothetical protein
VDAVYQLPFEAAPEAFHQGIVITAAAPTHARNDAGCQKAAAEFLNAPKSNAAYARFESSLLVAFDGMQRLAVPPADKKPNVFDLRTYLSSSEGKGLNKIMMFENGKIPLLKAVGLARSFTDGRLPD